MENFILGAVQGITEWLPLSSEGFILLIKNKFFSTLGETTNILALVQLSLFLHLGTFLAALVYLHKEVWQLLKTVIHYRQAAVAERSILRFLIGVTLVSGVLGLLILQFLIKVFKETDLIESSRLLTLLIGLLLLVTALLQLTRKSHLTLRGKEQLNFSDALLTGVAQGLAVLPGLSRSGLTVAVLLARRYDDQLSLRLSFLLSLPIVLAGNLILNYDSLSFNSDAWLGLLAAFIFGWLTIHYLLRLAEKLNFGYFVLLFAVLVIVSVFVL